MKVRFAPAIANLPLVHQGKTRDTFATRSKEHLLVVATDRLSTHNVVHESRVPYKGEVLTALTVFWLTEVLEAQGIPHHLVAYGKKIYDYLPGNPEDYPRDLHLRGIIVQKLEMIPIEFVFRGYLAGSLYREYYSCGKPDPYGLNLVRGLRLMKGFFPPLFTPTEKSENDEPLGCAETYRRYPRATAIAQRTFEIVRGRMNAVGLELVDSKFEVGSNSEGQVVLADEIATPDSSRFCQLLDIKEGQEPPWLDKQIARDEAQRMWNGSPKHPLAFDARTVEKLRGTYDWIFSMVTKRSLSNFQRERLG